MFGNNSFGGTPFGSTTFGAGFGATPGMGAFGSAPQATAQPSGPVGTTIRFVPLSGTDTVPKTGTNSGPSQITTRHQNISAMKEYETKSVEELRLEDYAANRKVGQPQTGFSSTPFGSMQPSTSQQSTSIFGASPQATPNLFGSPAQNQTTNIFGQPKSGFDLNSSSNIFNSSLNKPNTTVSNTPFNIGNQFNTTSTASSQTGFPLFNNNAQTNTTPFGGSGGPFKTNMFASPSASTSSIFNTNTSTSGFLNSSQNNAATQPQNFGASTSIFGQASNNTSTFASNNLFNTQPKPGFELNSTSGTGIFNTLNKPATTTANTSPFQIGTPFNTTNTSLFGSNSQTNTTPFGANSLSTPNKTNLFSAPTTTTTSIFGTSTSTNTSGFLGQSQPLGSQAQPFGQTNSTSIFAPSSALNQTTSLFSSGNNSTSQPFSFPSTNTQPTSSLFNTTLSNDANKSAFSLPSSNSMFNFGASSVGNTLTLNTSTTTAPLFGGTTTSTSSNPGLFSGLSNNLSFGQANTSTGLFDTNSVQNNLFNTTQQQNQASANKPQSPQGSDLILNRLKTLPYGETSLYLNDTSSSAGFGSIKFTTDPKTINQYKMSAKTNVRLNKPTSSERTGANSVLFDGLDDNNSEDLRCAIDVFVPKKSIKKLDLKPSSRESDVNADSTFDSRTFEQSRSSLNSRSFKEGVSEGDGVPSRHVSFANNMFSSSRSETNVSHSTNRSNLSPSSNLSSFQTTTPTRSSFTFQSQRSVSDLSGKGFAHSKSGLISTRPDYKLKPSLEEIENSYNSENDTCFINSLMIERPNYGYIQFESPIDVKGINLDEIVHIRRKEVVVYPNDENKPPIGQGLNRPAIVTLHQVWPIDKSNNEVIKDVDRLNLMKYPEKIEAATVEKGARFIEYRPETGSWVFAVKHFSKYGITDDDEELDRNVVQNFPSQSHQPSQQQIRHNLLQPVIQTRPKSDGLLLNRLKYIGESTPNTSSVSNGVKPQDESGTQVSQYKMSLKNNTRLTKPHSSDKSKTNSILFDSIDNSSNCSMRNAIDELFDEDEDLDGKKSDVKRSLTVHGTKRLALQNLSPNVSSASFDKPILTGANVPRQQRVRELTLKPDLYAGRHKVVRDIMSVCVAGSPKIRFFNGSRNLCSIRGDSVTIHELKLVPSTSDGSLSESLSNRFSTFLDDNSIVTPLNMNPTLAPYIETYDFISNASSYDLLHALYGGLSSKTPYAKQDERLNRVIRWLASVNTKLPPPTNFYQLIIYHMSCDRYDLASTLAIENNHPRLALLVATLNLNKDLIFEQLSSWRLSTADQFVDPELLKIYILLSGLTEWRLSNDITVYCLKGLKWTQQLCLLALHVTSFITEPEKYGFHMLPLYIKRLDTNTNDVDYHILARHNPANILSASGSLIEEWFLLESLKSFHVINSESECINSDIIHCNLASQLASIDLRWSCFVALHIINNEVRNQVLIRCLEQNHNQLKTEVQEFSKPTALTTVESWLIERLKVPVEFIEHSKSLAAKAN